MADCSYHPGKEAVGACINCGKMACLACRTELQGKVYCQPCADKLFVNKKVRDQKARNMLIVGIVLTVIAVIIILSAESRQSLMQSLLAERSISVRHRPLNTVNPRGNIISFQGSP